MARTSYPAEVAALRYRFQLTWRQSGQKVTAHLEAHLANDAAACTHARHLADNLHRAGLSHISVETFDTITDRSLGVFALGPAYMPLGDH